jgi:beta-lactam-binding protein with PASTA domain
VPDVSDLTRAEATTQLTGAGFQVAVDPQCRDPEEGQDGDVVVEQNPAAEAQAAPGATVTLVVTCEPDG